jgi:hypothetical protein
MICRREISIASSFAALTLSAAALHAQSNGVTAGELVVEPPTLISLGFEWYVNGDANRNSSVDVQYRAKGTTQWRRGLPFLRINAERTVYGETLNYTAPNMLAGSLFDLAEDTLYEVRVTLNDPEGVAGNAQRTVEVRTRAEPQAPSGGRVLHVYPPGFAGEKREPAFMGLLAAYYKTALGGDWSRASPPRVEPGDTILVHAGVYKDFDRLNYSHEIQSGFTTCCGTPWDGTYFLSKGGTAEKPIAIKAAGDGEVIFDGDGNTVLFNVIAADYLYF